MTHGDGRDARSPGTRRAATALVAVGGLLVGTLVGVAWRAVPTAVLVVAVLVAAALVFVVQARICGRETRAADRVLRESNRRMAEAERLAGLGSFECDVVSDEVRWSDGLYALAGRDPASFTPTFTGWIATVHPEDRESVVATVSGAVREGRDYELDHRILTADGEVRDWHVVGHVVTDDAERPLRVFGSAQDVTGIRRVQRAKDEFVAVVSHELRTPLSSVHGALDLLDSGALGELPERARRLVTTALRNTDRLIRLVNDILDVHRLAAGEMDLAPEQVTTGALIDEALGLMDRIAAERGVVLTSGGITDATVHADRDRVVQVLTNLLGNAVRFCDPGGRVTVSTRRADDAVVVEVADDGRGIPPGHLESIFERFEQVDASDARERRGTGLGLTICRSIVEQHGGRIWAASDGVGRGARVSFTLPRARVAAGRPTVEVGS